VTKRGNSRNERPRIDRLAQMHLEAGLQRFLAILFAGERGERGCGYRRCAGGSQCPEFTDERAVRPACRDEPIRTITDSAASVRRDFPINRNAGDVATGMPMRSDVRIEYLMCGSLAIYASRDA